MSAEHEKSSINWGGIGKGILAGGAIIAGIAIVCPGMLTGVVEGLSKIGTAAPAAVAAEPGMVENAISGFTGGIASMIGKGITSIALKVAGVALVVTGANYLMSDKSTSNAEEHATRHAEAKESFALREDMRKMQAVMVARMQNAGQEIPAATTGRV